MPLLIEGEESGCWGDNQQVHSNTHRHRYSQCHPLLASHWGKVSRVAMQREVK